MYKLNIGCHRGTVSSRDSEVRKYETLEEAVKSYEQSRDSWRSIGYHVWFAEISNEAGEIVKRFPGTSYKR